MIYDDDEQFFIRIALHLVACAICHILSLVCLSFRKMGKMNLKDVRITRIQDAQNIGMTNI